MSAEKFWRGIPIGSRKCLSDGVKCGFSVPFVVRLEADEEGKQVAKSNSAHVNPLKPVIQIIWQRFSLAMQAPNKAQDSNPQFKNYEDVLTSPMHCGVWFCTHAFFYLTFKRYPSGIETQKKINKTPGCHLFLFFSGPI